ncbi:MAG: hypothetical protein ACRCYU_03875 [Nocardioides sp.]
MSKAIVSHATPARVTVAILVLFLVVVGLCDPGDAQSADAPRPGHVVRPTTTGPTTTGPTTTGPTDAPAAGQSAGPSAGASAESPSADDIAMPWTTSLPGGGTKIFDRARFLVAYYGTARSAALGVLGEQPADLIMPRLRSTGRAFKRTGEQIQPVFELIVTVADPRPGKDGDYNHDIPREYVERYIAAAHRNKALLVLDLQPGRASFAEVAKRWDWALADPWVGLALDPEWRMGPRQVPGQVIGSVGADEVNRVSGWLAAMIRRKGLPEKALIVHQFRASMIRDIGRIKARPGLAMIQHVDGFGNPGQKIGTFRAIARPRQFTLGFKLFYDEDRPRMRAADVRRLSTAIRFVSFQ